MLLAQAQEIAASAQRELARAADYGFAAYCLVLFFVVVIGGIGVHFWFVVRPDQRQRLDSQKNQDHCMSVFAENYAVQTQILKQLDADLSTIRRDVSSIRCPIANNPSIIAGQSVGTIQHAGA